MDSGTIESGIVEDADRRPLVVEFLELVLV